MSRLVPLLFYLVETAVAGFIAFVLVDALFEPLIASHALLYWVVPVVGAFFCILIYRLVRSPI